MRFNSEIIRAVNRIRLQNTDIFLIYWFKIIAGKSGKTAVSRKEHYHNFIEIHFFLNGCCSYDFNGTAVTVEANQYLLIPALRNHRITDISDDFTRLSIGFELTTEQNNPGFGHIYSDFTDEITEWIDFTVGQAMKPDAFSEELIRNRTFEVLLDILYQKSKRPKKQENHAPDEDIRLIKAKKFITDNLTHSLSGKDIAQYCYLSERQLNRIFLKHEGLTVSRYIHTVRLQTAKELLENTDLRLMEISELSGFSNEYYFNRFFKERIGMTPNEYRNSLSRKK